MTANKSQTTCQALRRQRTTYAHCPRRSHHREATPGPRPASLPQGKEPAPAACSSPAPPPPPCRPGGVAPPASAGKPHSPRLALPSTARSARALHDGRPGFPGAGGRLPVRSRRGRVYDLFHSFRGHHFHRPSRGAATPPPLEFYLGAVVDLRTLPTKTPRFRKSGAV